MQIMYKLFAAVAIAATQLSGAAACGWLNEKCCDVQYNNPNIGTCIQSRTVCWEAQCMMCGVNGKPKCPSAHPNEPLIDLHSALCVQEAAMRHSGS